MIQLSQIEQRIKEAVRSGKADNVRAIGDFRARWKQVSLEIDQLPEAEMEATFELMYRELEETLMNFELFALRRRKAALDQSSRRRPLNWRN